MKGKRKEKELEKGREGREETRAENFFSDVNIAAFSPSSPQSFVVR